MRKTSLLAGLIMLVAATSFAKFPGLLQRYELFYTYPISWAEYTRKDKILAPGASVSIDTTMTYNVQSKLAYGAGIGTFFPLKQLGRKSKLALDVGILANIYTFDYPTTTFSGLNSDGTFDYTDGLAFSGATMSMAVPIGVSAKIGCDAMQDKKIRWCWSGGVGVYPSYNISVDFDNIDAQFAVQPYVRTEVGIYAGVCIKLRAQFAFLDAPYMKMGSKNSFSGFGNESNTSLTSKGNLNLSLVIMPFAFTWKRSEWWNTY